MPKYSLGRMVGVHKATNRPANRKLWGIAMIFIAIVCTLLGGVLGASLEPVSFSVSIPIAIMGGFILKAIKDKKD